MSGDVNYLDVEENSEGCALCVSRQAAVAREERGNGSIGLAALSPPPDAPPTLQSSSDTRQVVSPVGTSFDSFRFGCGAQHVIKTCYGQLR